MDAEPRPGNTYDMDEQQREAFARAVEEKKAAAKEASEQAGRKPAGNDDVTLDSTGDAQPGLQTDERRTQDVFSVRAKNSGHGKKTADKWNQ
jgi:hypothetical protein